jgi:hypothetical protein
MRWLIGATVAVFTFAALGTAVELASRQQPAAQARTVLPTPTVQRATATPSPYRRITTLGVATTARLMVNEGAYLIVQRALDEDDNRTLFWAWETYEYLDVTPGTRVKILKTDGRAYHLEVLDGRHASRRGWVSGLYIGPA